MNEIKLSTIDKVKNIQRVELSRYKFIKPKIDRIKADQVDIIE